jgi:hypothetical protein
MFPQFQPGETLPEDFYEWLAETYSRQPEPLWMNTVARLPLNAIFTSATDPSIARAFRIDGRELEFVISSQDNPATPRNRRHLHITYLFGRAGERNPSEAPPRSIQELRRRTALHASPLLTRIVETTTSLGVLLVDGLTCGRDWLRAEDLAGVLSAFSPGQVYWFGWNPQELPDDAAILRDLAAPSGPIVFVKDRLSAALSALELAHRIDLSSPPKFALEGSVTIGERVLEVRPATRLKVSTAASIVEDTWLSPLPGLGPDAEFEEFRRFHGQVEDAHRLIDGVRRGFAIERTFEASLLASVRQALTNAGQRQEPILIHGQSGSGKSLALARLAYKVRAELRYPVLLASRATRMAGVEEVDDFCLQAEEAGAEATLVICDVNMPAVRYADLLRGFTSRGRRIVLVGSAYRVVDEGPDARSSGRDRLQIVPAELDATESEALSQLVAARSGVALRAHPTRYLLPAIYRLLPDVRPRLAAGLAKEARSAEDDLRVRGAVKSASPAKPVGALGIALTESGLVDPRTLLDQRLEEFMGAISDAASNLIDLVMVPGKLDCPVPVNLLMRSVSGSEVIVDIASLFSGIDLFRWSSNDEDDLLIHPRLQVEADLIVARRLGTVAAEVEVALRLLANASPSSYGNSERRFALDLVHKLGPDGPFGRRYAAHYLEIARTLTEMRTRRGVEDPSLMLQEATLRRRAFRDAPPMTGLDPATILEEARQVVDLALDRFGLSKSPGLRRACANLKVERAAIYGFRAVQQLKLGADLDEVWQFYKGARDSARSAAYAADSYFAIDVSVWVPTDLLRDGEWDQEKRAELIADIWDGIERVDPAQLDPEQRERFEERRVKVAQALGDKPLEQEALLALDRAGSTAGTFLRARDIGGLMWGPGKPSSEDASNASRAVSFLREHRQAIRDDARCQRYLLKGLWIAATGSYLFRGERSPLPEREDALREILTLLEDLTNLEGTLGDPRTEYLRAVLMWRLRQEHAAREVWQELGRETSFSDPRRVIRHHVWTEGGGKPRLFHGRVMSDAAGRGRARVQVEGIQQEVELLQRDFPEIELRRGASVTGGFHIAFNFIGPVADAPKRSGGGR